MNLAALARVHSERDLRHALAQREFFLVYQPMLEVLAYLRANGYKTFIVSGGSVDFMRPFTERVYGIPPEQVVGTILETKYDFAGNSATLVIEPRIALIDDGPGKASGRLVSPSGTVIAASGCASSKLIASPQRATTGGISAESTGRRGSPSGAS